MGGAAQVSAAPFYVRRVTDYRAILKRNVRVNILCGAVFLT